MRTSAVMRSLKVLLILASARRAKNVAQCEINGEKCANTKLIRSFAHAFAHTFSRPKKRGRNESNFSLLLAPKRNAAHKNKRKQISSTSHYFGLPLPMVPSGEITKEKEIGEKGGENEIKLINACVYTIHEYMNKWDCICIWISLCSDPSIRSVLHINMKRYSNIKNHKPKMFSHLQRLT